MKPFTWLLLFLLVFAISCKDLFLDKKSYKRVNVKKNEKVLEDFARKNRIGLIIDDDKAKKMFLDSEGKLFLQGMFSFVGVGDDVVMENIEITKTDGNEWVLTGRGMYKGDCRTIAVFLLKEGNDLILDSTIKFDICSGAPCSDCTDASPCKCNDKDENGNSVGFCNNTKGTILVIEDDD